MGNFVIFLFMIAEIVQRLPKTIAIIKVIKYRYYFPSFIWHTVSSEISFWHRVKYLQGTGTYTFNIVELIAKMSMLLCCLSISIVLSIYFAIYAFGISGDFFYIYILHDTIQDRPCRNDLCIEDEVNIIVCIRQVN